MTYARDIQKLRRHTLFGQAASLLVFVTGVISIILFFNPGLIGIPQKQQRFYQDHWLWLVTGMFFVAFAILTIIFAGKRSRHAIRVFNNVTPELMRLTIEIEHWSDSTDYYANLSSEETEDESTWKVGLYNPSWDVETLAGKQVPAKVYLDPKTKKPVIIETEFGLLWAGAISSKPPG
jgi:hypothetical protein